MFPLRRGWLPEATYTNGDRFALVIPLGASGLRISLDGTSPIDVYTWLDITKDAVH